MVKYWSKKKKLNVFNTVFKAFGLKFNCWTISPAHPNDPNYPCYFIGMLWPSVQIWVVVKWSRATTPKIMFQRKLIFPNTLYVVNNKNSPCGKLTLQKLQVQVKSTLFNTFSQVRLMMTPFYRRWLYFLLNYIFALL